MKKVNIVLFEEEKESLLNYNKICIYEDEDKEIFIRISKPKYNEEEHKKEILKEDILDRYNNEEYWDFSLLSDFKEIKLKELEKNA